MFSLTKFRKNILTTVYGCEIDPVPALLMRKSLVLKSKTILSSVITSCVCQISFSMFTTKFAKFLVQNVNWEMLQITILKELGTHPRNMRSLTIFCVSSLLKDE